MKSNYFLFAIIISFVSVAQVSLKVPLDGLLEETSGLIYFDGRVITHNDSGGKPSLYEVDEFTGSVTRVVTINNATNVDWEDITYDDTYFYIGDFGNNNGTRKDLKIYRILISDYLKKDVVTADIINFNYSDQKDFVSSQFSTNFDAEALISCNNRLYIFTKNWSNKRSNVYEIPNKPGNYKIDKIISLDVDGLVTSATYNPLSNTILLTGYTIFFPFIIEITNFTDNDFSNVTFKKHGIQPPLGFSTQIEGIDFINENQYYLTAEKNSVGNSGLYLFDGKDILDFNSDKDSSGLLFPNPASDILEISKKDMTYVEIYDLNGILQKKSTFAKVIISDLSIGQYIIIIRTSKRGGTIIKKLMVN